MKIKAPAKVNTILKIVGRRANGYHDLAMVMEKLSLCDELEFELTDGAIELTQDGQSDAGMEAQKNLAWRAAAALKEAAGVKQGVHIHLNKRIPVAAGLGGGSSNAAAALKGCNEVWGLNWSKDQLAQVGAKLGADVPFFIYDGPALVEGVGDRVRPLQKLPTLFILLINPGFAVSTPWAYGAWDELHDVGDNWKLDRKIKWLTVNEAGDTVPPLFETEADVVSHLDNDLEEVTAGAHSEINEIKTFLTDAGASGALMAGSGPTVFGIFSDARSRDDAAAKVKNSSWRVIATEN
jgi:4-diphosphocytidyl-2-C-methyl-D-erythritol kinase